VIVLRILGHLWAVPNTLAGLAIGLACATFAGWDGTCLRFVSRPSGPTAAFFRRFGMAAFTWGAVVVVATPSHLERPRLLRHERRHVTQQLVFGPLMLPAYGLASLWALVRGGDPYRDNVFERDARAAE
jgi:hypothetical protein